MIFDKAYDAYPVCVLTRSSIITGEYPQIHRQQGNAQFLVEAGPTSKIPSLGHVFSDAGYNTALIGKTHSNMLQWDKSLEALTGAPNPAWEQAVWATAPKPPFSSGNTGNKAVYTIDGMTNFDAIEYLEQYAKGTANSDFKINKPTAPFFCMYLFRNPMSRGKR